MATGNAARYITSTICVAVVAACGPVAPRTAPTPAQSPTGATSRDAAPAELGTPAVGADASGDHQEGSDSLPDGLGQSPATAIEVCRPLGQEAYLRRLRCADDRAPAFSRKGQRGYRSPRHTDDDYQRSADQVRTFRELTADETDLHPVDVYEVRCGKALRELYLDMYHCPSTEPSTEAPPGFTLASEPEK